MNIGKEVIDYSEQVGGTCFLVKNFFDSEECKSLIMNAENLGFVNANDKYPQSYRTNKRCWEDNPTLAKQLWKTLSEVKEQGAAISFRQTLSKATSLNPRLRYCRYDQNEIFYTHRDGRYYKSENEYSKLTFLLYLTPANEYEGGDTRFFASQNPESEIWRFKGNQGDLLLFDHSLWHEGEAITHGYKHILRSDVLFQSESSKAKGNAHLGYIWALSNWNGQLVSAGRDKTIKIWNENQDLKASLSVHDSSVLDLAVKEDLLFSVSRDSCIACIERVEGGFKVRKRALTSHGTVLTLDAGLTEGIISAGSDGVIRLWTTDLILVDQVTAHAGWCWQVLAINTHMLLSAGSDGYIKSWTVSNGKIMNCDSWHVSNSPLRTLANHGDSVWAGNEQGEIIHFDLQDHLVRSITQIHAGIVRSVHVFRCTLYSCGEDGNVFEIDLTTLKKRRLGSHDDFATSIAFVNGQLISGGYDGKLRGNHSVHEVGASNDINLSIQSS